MKALFFSLFLIMTIGCARVDLVINNQGDGPMRDLKIEFKDHKFQISEIAKGAAWRMDGLKFEKRSGPRINYRNAAGGLIWASAAVEIGPGDKGEVELERRTKNGAEEFIVHDRRKKVSKK